jgi:hypothetical protein
MGATENFHRYNGKKNVVRDKKSSKKYLFPHGFSIGCGFDPLH